MTKVILGVTISLDGFVEDSKGSVDALYPYLDTLRNTNLIANGGKLQFKLHPLVADGDLCPQFLCQMCCLLPNLVFEQRG